jgi:hypothetical protein
MKRPSREHPPCREIIESQGWVPHVLRDASGTYWDGFTAQDAGGRIAGLSGSLRTQMIATIIDGDFGEEVKDARVDDVRYWKIRDDLITWPNQNIISRKALSVVEIRGAGEA